MSKININIGGVIIEVDKEDASKAIEAGELKVTSDELVILKKSDENVIYEKDKFETFKTNLSDEQYKKGRLDASEMLLKGIKKASELDFDIKVFKNETENVDFEKTSETFVNNISSKFEEKAGIEPSKKLQEAENNFKTMQQNYSDLKTEFDEYKNGITTKEIRTKKDNAILSYIPEKGLIVSPDIALIALKEKSSVDIDISEEGKHIPMLNGSIKKDEKTLDPVDPKEFILNSLTSLNLIKKAEGGSGEEDETGKGQATDYEKFVKEMATQNIDIGSEKFALEMNKRINEKTLTI